MTSSPENGPDFSRGDGLLPAIAQDAQTGDVLMLAYMNAESYAETLATGRAVYYSRSRKNCGARERRAATCNASKPSTWIATRDTILLSVEQVGGAACHEGYRSCFFRQVTPEGLKVVGQRVFDPAKSTERNSSGSGQDLKSELKKS